LGAVKRLPKYRHGYRTAEFGEKRIQWKFRREKITLILTEARVVMVCDGGRGSPQSKHIE